jgi:hypothetical protein
MDLLATLCGEMAQQVVLVILLLVVLSMQKAVGYNAAARTALLVS